MSAEGLPNRVIRELSVGIGPRVGGSEGSHRARDVIAVDAVAQELDRRPGL